MEVTTVSPSPASPTEWDDLCEIDVTNVAIHSVTLLICLCGLVGNGAVLFILKRCSTVLFGLALADFVFLLFTVPTTLVFLVEDMSCSIVMPLPYLTLLFLLSVFCCYWALHQVTVSSNIVYLDKLYELFCCCCNLSKCLVLCVFRILYFAFIIVIFSSPALTNLCPSLQQGHCRAAFMSMNAVILLLFAAPLVIFHTINFIKAKRGSTGQRPKRRDIVVFLIVLFLLLLSYFNVLQQLGYTVMTSEVFFLVNCIQSSIKPFIFFLAGGCQRPCSLGSLRLSLQRLFDEQKLKSVLRNTAPMVTGV